MCREVLVHSMDEAARLLEAGNMHRAVAAHNLNEHSSRSHAICTVQMEQRLRHGAAAGPEAQRFLRSKLHLVDLAGDSAPHPAALPSRKQSAAGRDAPDSQL